VAFSKTADLYDQPLSDELSKTFLETYIQGRSHYSVKDKTELPFVRCCQICRKTVIPAYYKEAVTRGIQVVVLGINEWAGLSQKTDADDYVFSSIRKLEPVVGGPVVYVVHLPFLLQMKKSDTVRILEKFGWEKPKDEEFVESNSNSCLLSFAAESKANVLLGFHPDVTRLSREVTVGFLTKEDARKAMNSIRGYHLTVREVLKQANVIV